MQPSTLQQLAPDLLTLFAFSLGPGPDFVKSSTGFSIGGVSPVAHATKVVTLMDQELQRFETVWAAAGHPYGVFPATPAQLQALTAAPWADVVEQA